MINEVFVSNKIQQIKWSKVPSHRVNSVTIKFNFSEEWKDLLCVALFKQDGVCIPQLINEQDECLLPVELKAGTVVMSVFGNKQDGSAYRETTIKSEFTIYDSGYCEDMTPPVPPTPDLYEQLIKRFADMVTVDVDQIYNALSENAQSGKAVAQAVKGGVETANEYTDEQIANIPKPVLDHNELINRDAPDQHTIGSITGLQEELDKGVKIYSGTELPNYNSKFGKPMQQNINKDTPIKRGDLYYNTESKMLFRVLNVIVSSWASITYERVSIEQAVIDYVAQEIAKIPQGDVDKPIHTTMNVEIEDDGFGGYRADYNDNDINNHRNAGGIVQAKYYNQAENQTYTYYYSTMESDRKPTFIRTFINADGKIEQVLASVGNDKKVTVERRVADSVSQEYVDSQLSEKVNHSVVVVNDSKITQADARDVLEFAENYSGALIEFVSSTLSRTIGYGWIISNTDIFLITIDHTGTLTQWSKENFEKHAIESYSYINETIDIDNLTVDVAGNPPFMASVNDAINRPFKEKTSPKGKVFVIPYAIDCQVQMYMDMTTMKWYSRLVEGLADNHTFNQWQELSGGGVSQEYVDSTFAPVIKNTASGEVIAVDDVSPVAHKVAVKAEQANYCPFKTVEITSANTTGYVEKRFILKAGTYYVSAKISSSAPADQKYQLYFIIAGIIVSVKGDGTPVKFTLPSDNGYTRFFSRYAGSAGNTATWDNIIISKYPIPYVPYLDSVEGVKVTEATSGAVETITNGVATFNSSYPSMNFTSDNEGAYLTATYNTDTKKYIDNKFKELQNAVISQGANL